MRVWVVGNPNCTPGAKTKKGWKEISVERHKEKERGESRQALRYTHAHKIHKTAIDTNAALVYNSFGHITSLYVTSHHDGDEHTLRSDH